MKKILILISLMMMLGGCSKKATSIACSQSSEIDGVKYEVKTVIEYDEKMVNKKTNTEVYTFEDETTLDSYIEMMNLLKQVFEQANVEYEITKDGLTVSATSIIDYHTVDIATLVAIDPNEDKMMDATKNHTDLNNMLDIYKQVGRECK